MVTRQNKKAAKVKTVLLETKTAAQFEAAVMQAAAILRAGGLVALPTETVYGLAANALDAEAVKQIFEAKGRPSHNPIIVHVADLKMARACVAKWSAAASALAKSFWPGPLTLVLPRAEAIPAIVTAGGPTVGIRWPDHPLMLAVIKECGFPLAAPSANRSNQLSPTTAAHVYKDLAGKIPLIVDGGPSRIGIESTVFDLTVSPLRVLRAGMIHEESLAAVVGQGALRVGSTHVKPEAGALRSPGQLSKHYSPRARLLVLSWENDQALAQLLARNHVAPARTWILAYRRIPGRDFGGVCRMPREAAAYARALYAELHRCDEAGAEAIVVEAPPEGAEWRGIQDRLRRAGGAASD